MKSKLLLAVKMLRKEEFKMTWEQTRCHGQGRRRKSKESSSHNFWKSRDVSGGSRQAHATLSAVGRGKEF